MCGSDGQTYINKCLLDVTACANNETVRVVHEGPCGKRVKRGINMGLCYWLGGSYSDFCISFITIMPCVCL